MDLYQLKKNSRNNGSGWKIFVWGLFAWGIEGILSTIFLLDFPDILTIFHVIACLGVLLLYVDSFWLRFSLGIGWIANGLLSFLFLIGMLLSFMNPIDSMGIKVLTWPVFRLEGIDTIATYFVSRGFIFMTFGILIFWFPSSKKQNSLRISIHHPVR